MPSALVSAVDPGVSRAIAVAALGLAVLWFALRRAPGPLAAICVLALALSCAGLGFGQHFGVLAASLATIGVMLSVSARMRPHLVGAMPIAALMFMGTLAAALAAAQVHPGPAGVCLVAAATFLLTASVVTSSTAEAAAFDALSIVAAIAAITTAAASDEPVWVQCALAIAGASWLAVGWRRWHAGWLVFGIAGLAAPLFQLLGDADVVVVEATHFRSPRYCSRLVSSSCDDKRSPHRGWWPARHSPLASYRQASSRSSTSTRCGRWSSSQQAAC